MNPTEVLIIDDDSEFARLLATGLVPEFSCRIAASGEEGLGWLQAWIPAVVILDLVIEGGRSGLEILDQLRLADPTLPVVMLTAHPSAATEAEALRRGALYYMKKSLNRNELVTKLRKCAEVGSIARQRDSLRAERQQAATPFVATSQLMRQINEKLDRMAAASHTAVLITGESGSGKTRVASEIHRRSERADMPFLHINTASLNPELADSALFGHRRGSFTGAISDHKGYFEAARGGVLFLDEIGCLRTDVQAKLLTAVEDRRILPLGTTLPVQVDVRVIAATHNDLDAMVAGGKFRSDLLNRLAVLRLEVPPLRDHPDDIPDLARFFLGKLAAENHLSQITLTPEVLARMQRCQWRRNNIRELKNTIERAVVMHGSEGGLDVDAIEWPREDEPAESADYEAGKERAIIAFQRRFFERAFNAVGGSLHRPHPEDWSRVAELTHVSVRNLRRIVEELNGQARTTEHAQVR